MKEIWRGYVDNHSQHHHPHDHNDEGDGDDDIVEIISSPSMAEYERYLGSRGGSSSG